MLLELVCATLESIRARYAVIGGHAVAMRGHPRLTVDYDVFTTERRVFERQLWTSLQERGASVDIRTGDPDDPLAGVVHLELDEREADVVVGKWKWEEGVIERAEMMVLQGIPVPVPRTSDLILLKLSAGGYVDLQDVHALLHAAADREHLVQEVEQLIPALPGDARQSWERIVATDS